MDHRHFRFVSYLEMGPKKKAKVYLKTHLLGPPRDPKMLNFGVFYPINAFLSNEI